MAKAKKNETSTAASKSGGETGAPKAAAKKKSPGKAPAAAPSTPLIDTGLAAEAAAKLVGAKVPTSGNSTTGESTNAAGARPSASFKQMKEGLNKPASTAMANFLDKTGGPGGKKSSVPFGGPKQVGRNQTFGADVNRTGVPRRTGG